MNEKPSAPSTSKTTERAGVSIRVLAGLGLLAILLGRGLAPALPGFAVGMEGWIRWTDRIAALATQLVAAGGVAAALRLLTQGFATSDLKLKYRVTMLPASIAVLSLVMAAWSRTLDHELYFILALSTAAAAFIGASLVIKRLDTRACAIVLVLAGGGGLMHVVARRLAIDATEVAAPTTYLVARGLETLAFAIDMSVLGLTALYLRAPSPRVFASVVFGFVLIAFAIATVAVSGSLPGASSSSVLVARVLTGLLRSPTPFVPLIMRYAAEALAVIAVIAALFRRDERSRSGIVMVLAILSQGALDIPVPSLFLLLAALMTPHLADRKAAEERARTASDAARTSAPSPASGELEVGDQASRVHGAQVQEKP